MSREVFLPCWVAHNQYPEIGMWMQFFEKWQSEVDKLHVRFGMQHGNALADMVKSSSADVLLFMEMDGIVFKPHVVDKYFKMIESGQYDVIGSPRMSCNPEWARVAKQRFDLHYEGEGDKGPNFWPNFFFVRRDLLLQTDLDFGVHQWKKGETVYGVEVQEDCSADTMGWMSIQLRALTSKIREVPQYHTSPWDLEDYDKHKGIFDGNCEYIHIGSISAPVFEPHSDLEKNELTKRLVWQDICGKDIRKWVIQYLPHQEDLDKYEKWKRLYKDLLCLPST